MRKVLLIGLPLGTSTDQAKDFETRIQDLFPDHEIRAIPGMISAVEFNENTQVLNAPAD